jgi:hypothetical protein
MKKIIYTLSFIALTFGVNAQLIVSDDFSATAGSALTSNGWTVTAANVTNVINTVSPGLTFTDYVNTGVGNAAALANTGQDVFIGGTASNVDSVYATAMISVSAAQATGDYFFGLLPNNSNTNFVGRVFIKSTSGGFLMGLAKGSTGTVYGTTVYALNTTYAIALKYAFRASSSTDDEVTLYVFTTSMPLTDPTTPEVGPISGTTDAPNISRMLLRQGSASNASTLTIDGVRLGRPWALGVLPVKWKSFTATKNTDATLLKWSTASETNNNYFEVQRSMDGKKFEAIGSVKGNGTTNKVSNYSFTDSKLATSKTVFYRLKQLDFDGKAEFSKTVSVTHEEIQMGLGASLPNPFNNELTLTLNANNTSSTATIVIMDMIGKTHYASTEQLLSGANTITINTTNMPDGIYFIRASYNGQTFTQKVVKK